MRILICTAAALLVAVPAWADDKPKPKTYAIPYKLTMTNHVMVRAKINGKGPFNFIVDTGAPALFVATKVAEKSGTKPDKNDWGKFEKFELEGGLMIENAAGKIADPFQLEGMNGTGLAGVELHGMIGYNLLARYKITYDFTSDKLLLTDLPGFDPGKVPSFGNGSGQGGLEIIGKLMKIFGPLLGLQMPQYKPRGYLGIEVDDSKDGVTIKKVLPSSPAEKAGLMAGDRLVKLSKDKIDRAVDLLKSASRGVAGNEIVLVVERDGAEKKITVTLGRGL